jgi:hypothetical protein
MKVAEDLHRTNCIIPSVPLPPVDVQREKLQSLNPEATADDDLGEPSDRSTRTSPLVFEVRGLKLAIRKLSFATASGWTGWTNRLIRRIVLYSSEVDAILTDLCKFYQQWADVVLHPDVAQLFCVARGAS